MKGRKIGNQDELLKYAIRRAASIGIDARQLSTKGLLSLVKLFNAIDSCLKDYDETIKKTKRYQVNPTNLEQYGIALSTINHSAILKEVVTHYQKKQDDMIPAIPRKQHLNLLEETKILREWHKEDIRTQVVIQNLQDEINRLIKENHQLKKLYRQEKDLEPFNEILRQKR